MKIYIASPYTIGDKQKNVAKQIEVANILLSLGHYPFWPLSCHYLHEAKNRDYETWMRYDLEWLKVCDCLLRLPGESKGADIEEQFARENQIPIYYETDLSQLQEMGRL